MLLEQLASRHEITVVSLRWGAADDVALDALRAREIETHAVPHGAVARARALRGDPRRPLQQVVATSPAFSSLVRRLIAEGSRRGRPYDVVHVEHLRGAAALHLENATGVHTVFDAVDCIAELARLARRTSPNRLVRWLARYEEDRTRRLESVYVASAAVTTVVAERDRAALERGGACGRIEVVPNGVPVRSTPVPLTGEPVAIFTGKLSYHANQAALRWLLAEIWPLVRAEVPEARLIVAGADPPAWLRRAESDGVLVIPNPPRMDVCIEQARVALAPIVYSVGIQNKVLEAMARGVPVVATSSAVEGLPPQARPAVLPSESAHEFALATARLLTDDALASALGHAGHDYVAQHHRWERVAERFEQLYRGEYAQAVAA